MTNPTTSRSGNKPTFTAYQVRESGNGSVFRTRIGAAWENQNGSISIQLGAVPLDGYIVCIPSKATTQSE